MNGMRRSVWQYVIGFLGSLAITIVAYVLVTQQLMAGFGLLIAIMGLAFLQLVLQLVCFLHLGEERGPRWNLAAFLFMGLVLLIVVGGSLWIMHHLNYNMMTPQQTDEYMIKQHSKGF